ncbi:hypothetical protein, partial [Klebsiella pneumoniae]
VRVEADLARAGLDGVLPGLVKAAGRPGRLGFTYAEGAGGAAELRDIAFEAGSASGRGSAVIGPEGALDRAEFASLKLSPGDDMRVAVDR